MTGGLGLATRRVLDAEEDEALGRLTGSRIGCAEFLHLFDLFLGELHRLPVMSVVVEERSRFFRAPRRVPRVEALERADDAILEQHEERDQRENHCNR